MELSFPTLTSTDFKKSQTVRDDSLRKRAYREDFAVILSERYREIVSNQVPGSLRDQIQLQEIRNALKRVSLGTFGACQVCENPIEHELLLRIPFARQCLGCKLKYQDA